MMREFREGISIKFLCKCGKKIKLSANLLTQEREGRCPRCQETLATLDLGNSAFSFLCDCGHLLEKQETSCKHCSRSLYASPKPSPEEHPAEIVAELPETLNPIISPIRLRWNQRELIFYSVIALVIVFYFIDTTFFPPTPSFYEQESFLPQVPPPSIASKKASIPKALVNSQQVAPLPQIQTDSSATHLNPLDPSCLVQETKETKNSFSSRPQMVLSEMKEGSPPLEQSPQKRETPQQAKIFGNFEAEVGIGFFFLEAQSPLRTLAGAPPLTFRWELLDKPLSSNSTLEPSGKHCRLIPDEVGSYIVRLTVQRETQSLQKTVQLQARLSPLDQEREKSIAIKKTPLETEEIPENGDLPKKNIPKKELPPPLRPLKEEQGELPPMTPRMKGILQKMKGSRSLEELLILLEEITDLAIQESTHKEATSLLPGLLPYLQSKMWEVRAGTVYALGKMKRIEAIEPLILLLKKERTRVVLDIQEALTSITHLDFGSKHSRWKEFWDRNKDSFVRPKLASQNEGANNTFYGVTIQSQRLIFVVDRSGSMSAPAQFQGGESRIVGQAGVTTRLDVAKKELTKQIERFNPNIWFNIIFFDSSLVPLYEKLNPASPRNQEMTKGFIAKQQPTGGTNIYDALELALKDSFVDTIILLTDGSPTGGKITNPAEILTAIREINRSKRVKIYCIGIQAPETATFLKALATQNFGQYSSK